MTDWVRAGAGATLSRAIGWLGVALQVAVGVFPFAPSGLVLGGAAFIFVWVVWVCGFVAVLWIRRRAPRWAPGVPVLCLAIWLATVATFGSA